MAETRSLPSPRSANPLPLSALAARTLPPTPPQARPRRVLFGESFDPPPPPPPEPEIIAPTFTLEDLEITRSDAFAEGRKTGLQEASVSLAARQASALEACAKALAESIAAARAAAEGTTESLVRALLATLATHLPTHAAPLLPAHVETVLRDLRASLGPDVSLTVTVHPEVAEAVARAVESVAGSAGGPGDCVVRTDPAAEPTGVRVSWASAEITMDLAEIGAAVRRLLDETFASAGGNPATSGVTR